MDDEAQRRLDALESRVDELEANHAIVQLLVDYGTGLDRGEEDRLVSCFAEGGAWELHRDGAVARRYSSEEELRAWVRRHHAEPHPPHKHLFTNPSIHVRGDSAQATTYFLRVDARPPGTGEAPQVFAMGRYVDSIVRCPDGRWRFQLRVAHMEYGAAPPL